jgi:hypothetical protein
MLIISYSDPLPEHLHYLCIKALDRVRIPLSPPSFALTSFGWRGHPRKPFSLPLGRDTRRKMPCEASAKQGYRFNPTQMPSFALTSFGWRGHPRKPCSLPLGRDTRRRMPCEASAKQGYRFNPTQMPSFALTSFGWRGHPRKPFSLPLGRDTRRRMPCEASAKQGAPPNPPPDGSPAFPRASTPLLVWGRARQFRTAGGKGTGKLEVG